MTNKGFSGDYIGISSLELSLCADLTTCVAQLGQISEGYIP